MEQTLKAGTVYIDDRNNLYRIDEVFSPQHFCYSFKTPKGKAFESHGVMNTAVSGIFEQIAQGALRPLNPLTTSILYGPSND